MTGDGGPEMGKAHVLPVPRLPSIYETDAMSGCTPIRNENEDTDSHGLRSQIFMNYPRSSASYLRNRRHERQQADK